MHCNHGINELYRSWLSLCASTSPQASSITWRRLTWLWSCTFHLQEENMLKGTASWNVTRAENTVLLLITLPKVDIDCDSMFILGWTLCVQFLSRTDHHPLLSFSTLSFSCSISSSIPSVCSFPIISFSSTVPLSQYRPSSIPSKTSYSYISSFPILLL